MWRKLSKRKTKHHIPKKMFLPDISHSGGTGNEFTTSEMSKEMLKAHLAARLNVIKLDKTRVQSPDPHRCRFKH